ncbi:MAG TPA: hypothetical protein VIK33_18310 [Anaerolineae bacterium]
MDKRVKLLITYDIFGDDRQTYYQYVVGEFLPSAQQLGLVLVDAWHTVYGDYPARLLSFVARDRGTLASILHRDEWKQLEDKLLTFVSDYRRKIVPYRDRFQF